MLSEHGLEVYDPIKGESKTSFGKTSESIEFLGIEVVGDVVKPTKEAIERLLRKIDDILCFSSAQQAEVAASLSPVKK